MMFVLAILAACGKDAGTEPPRAFATLGVVIDGKPVAIDRAFIKRVSADAYVLQIGAGHGSCETLLSGTAAPPPNTTSFSLSIVKRVAATGIETYQAVDFWSRVLDAKPQLGEVKLDGTADPKTQVSLQLGRFADGTRFAMSGSLVAIGCGEIPPIGMGVPKVPHRSKATLTVAGKPLTVRGVTVRARQGVAAADLPDIVISTSPKDCSSVTLPAPVILERTDGVWRLLGTWFEEPITATAADAKALTFSANDVGKSDDGSTLELQLSGTGRIGGYEVALAGHVEAIECVR